MRKSPFRPFRAARLRRTGNRLRMRRDFSGQIIDSSEIVFNFAGTA